MTAVPLRFLLLHRGEPPAASPDPWAMSAGDRIVALARAIASSPGWLTRPPARLAVRTAPDPVIAAVGRFREADLRWLDAAAAQAATNLPRLRWLDHRAVEEAAHALAGALEATFGAAALRTFRYAPVPRGGNLVAGILAYLLDLPRDRLDSAHDNRDRDTPLVLVDDIAVSGLRLSETVAKRTERRLVVATLHAHPDLRAAFLAAHPRVEAFVSAQDLKDHAPADLGEGYAEWRERWRARAAPGTLWFGRPEHVAYPWNEPDVGVWNPVTEREESGWSLVPPERCLKRRRTPAVEVQVMAGAKGRWRPHPDVVVARAEGRVVVGHLGTGATFDLEGVAADLWDALLEAGDPQAAAERLSATYDADPLDLVADVDAFTTDLRTAGILTEAPA